MTPIDDFYYRRREASDYLRRYEDVTASRDDIEKIVLQFLSARFSQPPSSFQNDLDLGAAFSMNDAALRTMISELTRHLGASFKLSEQETTDFSNRVQDSLKTVSPLTVGQLINLLHDARKPQTQMFEAEQRRRVDLDRQLDQWAKEHDDLIRELGLPQSAPPAKRPKPAARADRPKPAPQVVKGEYVVWYGTNRQRYDASDLRKGYSAERDSKVHYGSCRVYIPEAHKIGSLGSPWWKRLITRTDDRLKLREIKKTDATSFWRQIARRLSRLSVAERHAVIFVHGYNVSFHDAALRAAQIGFDLSIKGTMAFFSWPSQGSLGGYIADSATIEASEQDITNFMLDFVTHSGAEAVHIIAHSMGNRGVLRAVNRIAHQAQQRSGVPFGQVILAAADVDSDTFRQLCGAYAQVARRTTLYVSERDRAVEASHWLHQFPRVGLMPPVCVARGIDTVGVTNVDLTLLGHGYIGDAREVLHDIHELITKGSPPEHRFGIKEETTPSGERFWMIRG